MSSGLYAKLCPSRVAISIVAVGALLFLLSFRLYGQASQQAPPPVTSGALPNLIRFSGRATSPDLGGNQLPHVVGITFALYEQSTGGPPLWMETQNVHPDSAGRFNVLLGATQPDGLPIALFASGQARWVAVQVDGQAEQPRVMLLPVPYALKAADAETIGGLPPSAFALAVPSALNSSRNPISATSPSANASGTPAAAVTGSGTAGFLPLWTSTSNISNSVLFQTGTGATAKVGINTATPAATLDVKGTLGVRGMLTMPAIGAATKTAGFSSQPLSFTSSVFNSSSSKATNEFFNWQAEPAGNNTPAPSATMNLLFGSGTNHAAETGLRIASNGLITFATGQTFPGTGIGTITGVTAGTDLTGGGTAGNITLNLDTTKVAQLQASNFFSASQTFNAAVGIGGFANNSGFTPLAVTSSNGFGTWLTLGNTSTGGHTWNIISAGGANAEGAGNLGITDLTGSSTIWLEGHVKTSAQATATASASDAYALEAQGTGAGFATAFLGGNRAGNPQFDGIGGFFEGGTGGSGGDGILVNAGSAFAADFLGNVSVIGNLSKNGGSFKIDHPLDPANKYLYHSFVESPDMKNIYDGNVTTDSQGSAVVVLPEWFEALNRDFRYQLTVLGQFAQAIVAEEISNHQFTIRTDKPGVKVSWQVTGIRQDAWANAHRIPVEQMKNATERGSYLNPELYGAPEEKSVAWANHPRVMKLAQQRREKARAQADSSTQERTAGR